MQLFTYSGRNAMGELVQGELDSQDSATLAKQLFSLGITPLKIAPKVQESKQLNLNSDVFEEKIKTLDVMMFSRQMYSLLKAGIPIISALKCLQEFVQHKALAAVITDLRASLDSGYELSAAMLSHPTVFNDFYVSMIRVGETTGMLDKVFLHLYEHLDFEKQMRDQTKAALRYPMFVMIAIAIAMVVINMFVIPSFATMFKNFGADLPWMTKLLLNFSHIIVVGWPYLSAATAGIVFSLSTYIASGKGKYQWHQLKLKLPIAGKIIYKSTMARFARGFALSTKSGLPIIGALGLVAHTVDNVYIGDKIRSMQLGIERGESISHTAVASGVFNLLVLQMIEVGEESGSLDEMMEEVADMYQRDVEYEIKTLNAQIEPILIVSLGAIVLVLALGVFLPIWDFSKVALHKT